MQPSDFSTYTHEAFAQLFDRHGGTDFNYLQNHFQRFKNTYLRLTSTWTFREPLYAVRNRSLVIPVGLAAALLTLAPVRADSDYPSQVKQLLEQRCMVCHGCYDAPCQLKLDAWAGLARGASKDKVYDGTRLHTAHLTRLFEDAQSVEQWRERGFYPVLNEEQPEAGTAMRMLELKQRHPLPASALLPDSFDLRLDRDQQCPKPGEFDEFARDYPLWGMPYALPGLSAQEHATLRDWLAEGARGVPLPPLPEAERDAVRRWEAFLNGDSLKQRLMSRYIYEHLFTGSLYFPDLPASSGYYHLVRSRTAPGEPIEPIATRRPYDDPGEGQWFYRLERSRTAALAKRHMPYALDATRMRRWQSLFLDPDYTVSALPSYAADVASNPFVAFRELPIEARYRFMLDEAQFTIMGFIKGPVCRGQVALNVIDDHFWVVFIDPQAQSGEYSAEFLAAQAEPLRLPSAQTDSLISLASWRRYAKSQLQFLKAKAQYLEVRTQAPAARIDLDMIWDGDGGNDNASLTVFRHFDTASVVKGLVGRQPKTAWVIDYSLLERIHYLLVAGFDVYGNVAHQLETRLYMDFLRMEGEQNFLFFLPQDRRIALRDFWYRDAPSSAKRYVLSDMVAFDRDTDIRFATDDPKAELLGRLQRRLFGATAERYAAAAPALAPLAAATGGGLRFMPEVAFTEVLDKRGESRIYTILRNSGFANNAQLFRERERRLPAEDYLTLASGFIGAYPNQFFQLTERDVPAFVDAIEALSSEQDYARLVERYGVRRTAPWFWHVSDKLAAHYQLEWPREAGLFDLNRYENR